MFWLYFYAPLAIISLAVGFFASWYVCRRNGKLWAGLALLFLPVPMLTLYFAILLTSGWYGDAAKYILLYMMVLVPPFWLGGVLALPFTKPAKKNP